MAATMDIRVPEEQIEGTRSQVLRWLKAVGETVVEHEPLIEIETDKVTVEVAAPASGVLREILKGEQEEVAPGEVLGRLETVGAVEQRGAAEHGGAVEQSGAAKQVPAADRAASPAGAAGARGRDASAKLSPAVRRLLRERGLDATAIRGTGEGGRITVDDVLAHDASGAASAESPRAPHSAQPQSRSTQAASSASETPLASHSVPHSAIRKRIAEHMVQSLLHTAPHVTTVFEADLTAVTAHRAAYKADFESRGAPLTFTAYFLMAAAAAIREVPEANSRWTDSALEIYDVINIGVATAIEGTGLVVPVLRDVASKDLFTVAKDLNALVTAARAGKLQPADVRGGTFTISNHGVSGSLLAAPIVINQPQSAILGIGNLEKRVTVGANDEIQIRPKCYVTLTIDHRVMDGHQANRFLQVFVNSLETWSAQ
ncbi:MAG TPA: dihydrolipoamide acetyltransferase family protein [Steroidobacteraceae bacterium]|nr:dihydrolipoamide acetyltransferase family protein [Steroidobacteraceae bacterium]